MKNLVVKKDFYEECRKILAERMSRNFPVPSRNEVYRIPTQMDRVHFEWAFRKVNQKRHFVVALDFEKDDLSENQALREIFMAPQVKVSLEKSLGEDVKSGFQRGNWTYICVVRPPTNDLRDLVPWAVEKMSILIQECEHLINGDGPRRKPKFSRNESLYGELPKNVEFCEGALSRALENRYERDPKARKVCLKELGYSCMVCEMNFLNEYGMIGKNFIHVHHRTPISLRKAEYKPNPLRDLVPVCPNCHGMLHYGRPWDSPRSTDELREIVTKQRGKRRK